MAPGAPSSKPLTSCFIRARVAGLFFTCESRDVDSHIAAHAMFVDAKDEASVAFYSHHGFIGMTDSPLKLFLPLETAKRILEP